MSEKIPTGGVLDMLSGVALLRGIPLASLAALARLGQRRTFSPGTILIQQGAIGDSLHVLLRGRVRVERAHPQFVEPVVLAELEPGQTAGEVGLLAGDAQPATVTVVEVTETWCVSAAALAQTLGQFPDVWAMGAPWLTWRSPLDYLALRERPAADGACVGERRTLEPSERLSPNGFRAYSG